MDLYELSPITQRNASSGSTCRSHWADDAGESGFDQKVSRLDEGLESRKPHRVNFMPNPITPTPLLRGAGRSLS